MTNFEVSIHFFLALAVILIVCRLVGRAVRRLGQPQVVGEMIAGVLLGPSLLGWLAPTVQAQLFPRPLLTVLYSAAQVGLVLYMFLVGLEFDIHLIRRRLRSAIAVSWAGILTPFALGALLAWHFHDAHELFGGGVSRWEAILFLGAAMSITAFPMLARIIVEAGLSGTSLGTLALAAGSADDAAAWCLLAAVLASFKADPAIALWAIAGGLAFVLFVLVGLRRWLVPIAARVLERNAFELWGLPGTLALLMLAAWYTDWCGIYAVFGAFVLGVAMPRGDFKERLEKQIAPLTVNLLLPLFFVYSGLNTRIGLVSSPGMWWTALQILAAACLGKGVACWAAARLCGEPPRDAIAIGALMNSRGLMELIILNIGLERGVISPTLFSMMVLMAIATTLMAMPIFRAVFRHGYVDRATVRAGAAV